MKWIFYFLAMAPFVLYAKKAPDFTITDYNNKVHTLYADYLDKEKVVVIDFFFVDCPPCNALAPAVTDAYKRWGSGNDRVQFFCLSTQTYDKNAQVKYYVVNRHGSNYPGAGDDGGAAAAIAPYRSGTFGNFIGTPSFAVIAPNGEVNYYVNLSLTDHAAFDTAIARALRIPSGKGGGGNGGGCTNTFKTEVLTTVKPTYTFITDFFDQYREYELINGSYACEFTLPQATSGLYVSMYNNQTVSDPQQNVTTADIVQIQKHILTNITLNNMQLAVADVNQSGSVTAADITELRKLILGQYSKFPKIPRAYATTHEPLLFTKTVASSIKYDDIINKTKSTNFGIWKFGDVTGAKNLKGDDLITRSDIDILHFDLKIDINSNGEYHYAIINKQDVNLLSYQFSIKTNVLGEIKNLKYLDGINGYDLSNFAIDKKRNSIRTLWNDPVSKGVNFYNNTVLFEFDSPDLMVFDINGPIADEFIFGNNNSSARMQLHIYSNHINLGPVLKLRETITKENIGWTGPANVNLVSIIDLNGNLQIESSVNSNEFNVSQLNRGLYFIRLTTAEGKTEVKKFIKL